MKPSHRFASITVRYVALAVIASAGLTAAGFAATPAGAADIYDRYGKTYDYDRSPYDDPRYADLYGDERRKRSQGYVRKYEEKRTYEDNDRRYEERRYSKTYRPDRYTNRYPERYDERQAYRDERAYRGGQRDPHYGHCVERHVIVNQLRRRGWQQFYPVSLNNGIARVRAYHPHKGRAILTIERCSGRLINVHRVAPRYARPVYRTYPRYYE